MCPSSPVRFPILGLQRMRSEQVNGSNSEIEKTCEAVTARFLPRSIVVRDNCERGITKAKTRRHNQLAF